MDSPNQVLTHAARAAAKQLNKQLNKPFQPPLVAARGAREGLWLEQVDGYHPEDGYYPSSVQVVVSLFHVETKIYSM